VLTWSASADGSRQAVLMRNEDPASLPKTTGPLFERLLVSAFGSPLAG
jgi:hypothetical protein